MIRENTSFEEEKDIYRVDFMHQKIMCSVVRVPMMNHLCGYVYITKDHPWFNKSYEEIDDLLEEGIHGGLTYGKLEGDQKKIGFDCGHFDDLIPITLPDSFPDEIKHQMDDILSRWGNVLSSYKNIYFVMEECKKLAEQVIKAGNR